MDQQTRPDWQVRALAAHQERQAEVATAKARRHQDACAELALALDNLLEPDDPVEVGPDGRARVDGVTFATWDDFGGVAFVFTCAHCGTETHQHFVDTPAEVGAALSDSRPRYCHVCHEQGRGQPAPMLAQRLATAQLNLRQSMLALKAVYTQLLADRDEYPEPIRQWSDDARKLLHAATVHTIDSFGLTGAAEASLADILAAEANAQPAQEAGE